MEYISKKVAAYGQFVLVYYIHNNIPVPSIFFPSYTFFAVFLVLLLLFPVSWKQIKRISTFLATNVFYVQRNVVFPHFIYSL